VQGAQRPLHVPLGLGLLLGIEVLHDVRLEDASVLAGAHDGAGVDIELLDQAPHRGGEHGVALGLGGRGGLGRRGGGWGCGLLLGLGLLGRGRRLGDRARLDDGQDRVGADHVALLVQDLAKHACRR